MKPFLDLLATSPKIKIDLALSVITNNGLPFCKININDHFYYDAIIEKPITLSVEVELLEPISIDITMLEKIYSENKETAIIIENIEIDEFKIVPNWTQLAYYINDKNINQPTNYLGFNGTWSLHTQVPFYKWLHQITGQGWYLEPITNNIV